MEGINTGKAMLHKPFPACPGRSIGKGWSIDVYHNKTTEKEEKIYHEVALVKKKPALLWAKMNPDSFYME